MITPQFTPADIERMLKDKIEKYQEKIVRILRYVGEKCINEAREYGSYQDSDRCMTAQKCYQHTVPTQARIPRKA